MLKDETFNFTLTFLNTRSGNCTFGKVMKTNTLNDTFTKDFYFFQN